MSLKTLQNFYKTTTSRAWAIGTGNRYVATLPTPSAGYLVINPSNTTKKEIVTYTAKGTDGNGNYVTVSARGVGGTTEQTHSVGEPVRMNIVAEHYSDIQTEITTLQDEIDTLVLQNAPNSSTTVKGIVKMSVAPASATEPIVVGDNDPRVNVSGAPTAYITTSAGAGDSGKVPKLNASGTLDVSFIPQLPFGNGADGTVVLDGANTYAFFTKVGNTYTLTRDIFCTTITVNNGITLVENGYAIYANGSIVNAGIIHNNGGNGGNGTGISQYGTAGVGGGGGTFTAGTNGQASQSGNGINGTNKTCLGSNGSAGGNANLGGTGGIAGTATAETVLMKPIVNSVNLTAGSEDSITELYRLIASTNGKSLSTSAGSGSGGSNAVTPGGGSGGTGGVVFLASPTITNTGSITSIGGNGGNGYDSGSGQGGGGAGGSGGTIFLIYKTLTAGTIIVTGGTKGLKGGGTATDGNDGLAGKIYKVKITNTVIA